jgi:hypothetical protein
MAFLAAGLASLPGLDGRQAPGRVMRIRRTTNFAGRP